MGNINFGAPRQIIEQICAALPVAAFVETGTYQGDTAAWASSHFKQVYTIEGSPEFRRLAQERHADKTNIEFLLGDSRSMLREVMSRLGESSALFWLDAHWMPGSFGEAHECPLLEEIAAIYQSPAEHVILIDDARLFVAPPPLPHKASDWPDITAVLAALNAPGRPTPYTVVLDDVIISVPASIRAPMEIFLQRYVTAQLEALPRVTENPVRRILRAVKRRLLG